MAKTKRMDQIKTILRTYLHCHSIKGTARRLGVSKNTVRDYLRLAQGCDIDIGTLLELPEDQLFKIFYAKEEQEAQGREAVFEQQVKGWLKDLKKVGVTRYLLWQEYREEHPDGYGYSQFCERLRRKIGYQELTLPIEHRPGDVLQLDFAGKKLYLVDPKTGELRPCEVLVGVLAHSQYTFAMALPSQSVMDFVKGINEALLFLGGVPAVILSDNLKAYVTKANRYEPSFNELCVQLAAHYQCDLQATRVAKPKDKASVENMVRTAYSRIYAPLRNDVFHSIEELNEAIGLQLAIHNETPFQKREGSRKSCFETYEKEQLSQLPNELFEPRKTVSAKIQRNYHVYLGEEKNYYSVPYQYAGKQATVIYSSKTVEIYVGPQRVATHTRLSRHDTYAYQTTESHMPNNHQEWKKAQGYDAAYFTSQATKIGPATEWAIAQILLSRRHEVQTYRSCLGVMSLARKYTPERLENACRRCQGAGKTTYTMLKNILERKLDIEPEQPDLFSPPTHDNIRGPQAYQ
jgi:transposase